MKIYLIAIKLFVISALLIVSNYDLALADRGNREVFSHYYHTWLSQAFDRGVQISGYIVKSEWLPDTNTLNATPSFQR